MNKNKEIYDLLSEGKIDNAISVLLEELEGEATVEKEPEIIKQEVETSDVYPECEHKEAEEVKEVVVEEVENVATEEKTPETMKQEIETKDVYPTDEHKETEEVKEVVVEEIEVNATVEKTPEIMKQEVETSDVYPECEHKETEEVKEVVVEDAVSEDILDSNPEAEKAEENYETPEKPAEVAIEKTEEVPSSEETAAEVEELLSEPVKAPAESAVERTEVELSESMKAILQLVDSINESLEADATVEKEVDIKELKVETDDVYPADEHKETEEVKEVVVESAPRTHKSDDTGMSHVETKYEYYDDNDAEDGEKRRVVVTKKSVDHADGSEEILSKEDRVNKGKSGRNYGSLKEESENVATEEKEPETIKQEVETSDVYPECEHKEAEEVKEVVVEEVEVNATVEKEPETMEQEVETDDVYPAGEHKQVEEIVEVVVEAAKLCSENGVPASLENITKYAKTLFEAESVALNVGDPAKKEYDADADIESSEMNGNEKEFKQYEDIQGSGAEAAKEEGSIVKPEDIQETVAYKSLKEACLLESDYFLTESYTVQTPEEKVTKLTEQVALLLARESMDPLYDELVKTSVRAQRLEEACKKKYKAKAEMKAKDIVESKKD